MDDLRHLQLVVLNIAKDIDLICRRNNIEYFLGGGGAIGAVRHKGFIPWDDDLDFLMTYDHYMKFIEVCKQDLDTNKYSVEFDQGGKPSLKIKLKGTSIIEKGKRNTGENDNCIFLDIFRLEKAPSRIILQKVQYFFSKIYVAYSLRNGEYIPQTVGKKILMCTASAMKIKFINTFVVNQVERYNKMTNEEYYGCFWGVTRFSNSFTSREIYGKPLYVPFEDTQLPVPEKYDDYLTQFFGDYMKLPPVEKRVSPHIESIKFGEY